MINHIPDYDINPGTLETERTYFQSVISSISKAISAEAGMLIRCTNTERATLIAHHNLPLYQSEEFLHTYNQIFEMETIERIGHFYDIKKLSGKAIFEKVIIVPLERSGIGLGHMLFFYHEEMNTESLLPALELLRCLISSTVILLEDLEEKLELQKELLDLAIQERKTVQDELMLILDSVPAGIFYKDKQGKLLRVNKMHRNYNQMSVDGIVNKWDTELFSMENAEKFRMDDEEVIASGASKLNIIEQIKTADSELWFRTDKVCLKNSQGEVIGIIGFSLDITKVKKSEEEVLKLNRFLNNIMENINVWFAVFGQNDELQIWNKAAEMISGYEKSELSGLGAVLDALYPLPEYHAKVFHEIKSKESLENYESMVCCKDGSRKLLSWNIRKLYDMDGNDEGIIFIGIDITERKKAEENIRYLSYHDKLTGLKNRAYFDELIEKPFGLSQYPISVMIGDLNGLKLTNDIFGHYEGDKLLIEMAKILKGACGDQAIISRWGGDEFAILLLNCSESSVEMVLKRIMQEVMEQNGSQIKFSIALGAVTVENSEINLIQALKDAEDKMYRNKLLESRSFRNMMVTSLEKTLAEKSHETEEHTKRVRQTCLKIGKAIGLTEEKINELGLLATLHDIGKIAIPERILNKPGPLDEEEMSIMQTHCEIGCRIAQASPELSHIAGAILSHHERYDGKGYPQGLKGEEIPIICRIINIVDSFDVMTHDRIYKKAITYQEAEKELLRCSGTQFDPDLVKKIVDVFKSGETVE
jgi:diguanylate cyclase (GGDEF)-like protein/PAS domain S-box-containing protein